VVKIRNFWGLSFNERNDIPMNLFGADVENLELVATKSPREHSKI
jgi:hypothetical protein